QHELDALDDRIGAGLRGGVLDRALEVVDDRKHLLEHAALHLELGILELALLALAQVLEISGRAQVAIPVLLLVLLGASELGLQIGLRRDPLDRDVGGGIGNAVARVLAFAVVRAHYRHTITNLALRGYCLEPPSSASSWVIASAVTSTTEITLP